MRKKILFTFLLLLILIPAAIAFNPINWVKSLFVMSPPEIERAWADPVKILPDQIMTTNIIVKDAYGIQEITAEIPNENGVDKVKLHLIEGDEKYGTWQNAWKEHDAKNEKWYTTKITVTNKKGIKAYAYVEWQDPTVSHPASQVTAGTFDSGNFTFDGTHYDLFIDDTNGGVAIGANVADTMLKINHSTNPSLSLTNWATGTFLMNLTENDDLVFSDDSGNIPLTLDTSGKVGIGTTTPSEKLAVNGNFSVCTDTCDDVHNAASGFAYFENNVEIDGFLIATHYKAGGINITSTSVNDDVWIQSADDIFLDMDYDGGQGGILEFYAEGSPVGQIDEDGNLDLSGSCTDGGVLGSTCGNDIAERWHSVESLKHTICEGMNRCRLDDDFESEFENGDVVCAESGLRNIIRPCNGAYDPMAVSVLSYNATITIGQLYNPYPISLAGNVAVKVICDKPIKQGDSLVSAEQSGWAMKLDVSDVTSFEELQRRNNAVFAKALEDCESGRKVIRAWI